jgi:hypothetical protein
MKCYIKDRYTFSTIKTYEISFYDIYLATLNDEKSKIVIPCNVAADEGDFVYCDNGWIGNIQTIEKDSNINSTDLRCVDLINLFDNDFGYYADNFNYTIEYAMEVYFGIYFSSSDPLFKMDFLYSKPSTSTYITLIPDKNKGFFNFKEFMFKALRTYNVFPKFALGKRFAKDCINIDISKNDETVQLIDFSSKAYKLISETYENETLSSVQSIIYTDDYYDTIAIWYLKTDGTITSVMPLEADRVKGKQSTLYILSSDSASEEQKVFDEFAKNKNTHQIEFSSDRELNFYDIVQMRIGTKILDSRISSIRVTSDTNKTIYTAGDLKSNLTDKLRGTI